MDMYADMADMVKASGVVCTLSSNICQWVFYHNADRVRRGEFQIRSLDQPIEQRHYMNCSGINPS